MCIFKLHYELHNLGNTENITTTIIIILILVLYTNNNIHSIIIHYITQQIEP